MRDCKFISIGLLGQKHGHIFKFAFFVQSSVRNYELLKISIFCQKDKENNNLANYSYRLTWSLWEKTPRKCKFT